MRRHIPRFLAATTLLAAALALAQDNADLFSKLDANKDGFVTADEVQDSQKALFERLVRNADKDGDQKLSQAEFQAGLKPDETPKPPLAGGQGFAGRYGGPKGDPREMFNRIDANKDGKLSKEELPQQNFAQIDVDGDGFVTPEEFARRVFGQRPPGAPGTPPAAAGRPNPNNDPDPEFIAALFDRTDSNSDGKLTKDEIPEDRRGMRMVLEQSGGDSITKQQLIRGLLALAQQPGGQPPRPESAPPRPEGQPPRRPDGAPERRPNGQPGMPPGGGLFAALDADRDGQLSTSEIVGAGTALLKLDRNGDGKLTPDEVFGPGGMPAGRPGEARPGVGRPGGFSVETFDKDKDGKVSKEEAPDRLKERFDQVDTNSDGFLDQAEMRQMIERMQKAGGKAGNRRPNSDKGSPDNK
jgi:Ca2+-binding EF-hand superfamily protein